ncbi:MAG: hypothetical protein ABJA81_02490 [Nocardioidaceae bacterium]
MLDSFTICLRAGASGHTFAMADAVRADQLINPQLDGAADIGDPARDIYYTHYGPSRSDGRDGFFHGAASPGYFELHPRLWQGWCRDTEVPSDPPPALDERPLFGHAVILNVELIDADGRPMGYLRNPIGIDIVIAPDSSPPTAHSLGC